MYRLYRLPGSVHATRLVSPFFSNPSFCCLAPLRPFLRSPSRPRLEIPAPTRRQKAAFKRRNARDEWNTQDASSLSWCLRRGRLRYWKTWFRKHRRWHCQLNDGTLPTYQDHMVNGFAQTSTCLWFCSTFHFEEMLPGPALNIHVHWVSSCHHVWLFRSFSRGNLAGLGNLKTSWQTCQAKIWLASALSRWVAQWEVESWSMLILLICIWNDQHNPSEYFTRFVSFLRVKQEGCPLDVDIFMDWNQVD